MQLTSSAFRDGEPIPRVYTGDGQDVSPPLSWTDIPAGTVELALIVDDPDAPTPEPWVHWVLYKIPAATRGLPQGVPNSVHLAEPPGAVQGKNSWTSGRTIGYGGPAPPRGHGVHHYHFRLYALGKPVKLGPQADKRALLQAMAGHILAEAELIGTYTR